MSRARLRARRAALTFRPGWDESALEHRVLLTTVLVQPTATITLAPTTLPDDTVNIAYNQTITASGGTGGYTFAVTAGTLPAGLNLDGNTGIISGTPTNTGASSFTITATDNTSETGSQNYTVTINPALAITTTTLPGSNVNVPYNQTIATTGGTGTPTFTLSSGTLPTGLTLSTAGVISGTPTATGNFTFGVTATDTVGATAVQNYTVNIHLALSLAPATLPNDTINVPYSQTVTASGGTGGYTYNVTTGALPPGLNLNSTTGAITGTPNTIGTSNFTITAKDSSNETVAQNYSITINPAVTITTNSLPGGTFGRTYSQTIAATGGTGALTFTVTSGSVPSGLTLDKNTGVLSGIPTATGQSTFGVTVSDTVGGTASRTYSMTIAQAITFQTTKLPNSSVGVPYSQTITASGGTGALTYSVSSGTLPAGLSLNAVTGVLSGTPTTAGAFGFTITATDTVGATGSNGFAVTINPQLQFQTTTLPNGAVAVPYSQQITATGGTGALTYTVPAGSLPAGLSLSSTGLLSGTPTVAGTSSFTVTVTDSANVTAKQTLSLTILPQGSATGPTVTSVERVNQGRHVTFKITFSTALDAATAQDLANYSVVPVRHSRLNGVAIPFISAAYDSASHSVTLTAFGKVPLNQEYVMTINGTTPSGVKDSSGSLLAGLNGAAGTNFVKYFGPEILAGQKGLLAASNRLVNSLTTAISKSTLTPGDVISLVSGVGSPGVLFGSDVVLARRIVGLSHSHSPTIGAVLDTVVQNVLNPKVSVLALSPTSLPNDTANVPYSQQITATGGTGSLTFAISAGALPTGLTINATTGLISGTPSTAGTFNFTVTATDTNNVSGSQPYSVVINPAITFTTTTLPAAVVNTAYSRQITTTGGTGAVTFAVTTGTLPAGLTLSSTGLLSGTATTTGTTTFTVTATDTVGATKSQPFTFAVNNPIVVSPTTLPNDTVNRAYSQTVSATGGGGTYTFTVTTGSLPTGLTLNQSTGAITGTPSAAGTFNFTVTATDTSSNTGAQAYTVTINPAINISPPTLPSAIRNTAYSQQLTTTGGTGAIVFTLTSGTLPNGLTLSTTGLISGTPTVTGASSFTITATDTVGATKVQNYTMFVNQSISLAPTSLPNDTVNVAYSQTIVASGGAGGYTYSVTSGTLPAGILLDPATGNLTGTPTAPGTFNFTVTAVDSASASGSQPYQVIINPAVQITTNTLPNGTINFPYSTTVAANGGTGSLTFSLASGTLPAGLNLDATSGAITGTPTATGTSTFTVKATDTVGAFATQPLAITIS